MREKVGEMFKIVMLTCALGFSAVYATDFQGLLFKDGDVRTLEDFDGQSVVVVYLNTSNPQSGGYLGVYDESSPYYSKIKDLHSRRITEKLPLQIIVAEQKDADYMMSKVAISHDSVKGVMYARVRPQTNFVDGKVGSAVLYQPDGETASTNLKALNDSNRSYGKFPIEGADLASQDVRTIWWRFVNNDYSIMKKLVSLAKKDEQAAILLGRIEKTYGARVRVLIFDLEPSDGVVKDNTGKQLDMFGNPVGSSPKHTNKKEVESGTEGTVLPEEEGAPFRTISTLKEYDELAACLERINKSKNLKKLVKIAGKRLKIAAKSDALTDELKARDLYRKTAAPSGKGARDIYNGYIKGFGFIAQRYSETEYGMYAQQEFDKLSSIGWQNFANNFRSGRF